MTSRSRFWRRSRKAGSRARRATSPTERVRAELATVELVWRPNHLREGIVRSVRAPGVLGFLSVLDEGRHEGRLARLERILARFGSYLERSLAHQAELALRSAPGADPVAASEDLCELHALTPREREVVSGIARGLLDKQIARELGVAVQTVKNHVKSALARTGARSRLDLVCRLTASRSLAPAPGPRPGSTGAGT